MNAEQRVLIIDSDLKNCKAIKYALTEYGIGAYYTLSVVDGIERLNRHNYELVILDISRSETDGFQLLRFMRNMRNMPILVLSSQGDIENQARAYEMGADDFIREAKDYFRCKLGIKRYAKEGQGSISDPWPSLILLKYPAEPVVCFLCLPDGEQSRWLADGGFLLGERTAGSRRGP